MVPLRIPTNFDTLQWKQNKSRCLWSANGLTEKNRSTLLRILSVVLLAVGSLPFFYFFATVDAGTHLWVLLIGVTLISISVTLSVLTVETNSSNLHFIFVLYFLTLFLFSMYRIRFNNLSPGDILLEYRAARMTLEEGTWRLARSSWQRVFSSTAVSLTPAIVSEITGLDLLILLTYVNRAVTAILPILLFRTINEVFKKVRLAAIASVLFSQLYFNFIKLMNLTRQQAAEIFLICSFFILLKMSSSGKKNHRAYIILVFIFLFSFISSHYTVNYFSFPIFLGIPFLGLILPYLPKKMLALAHLDRSHIKTLVSWQLFGLFLVLSLIWLSTVNSTNFLTDVSIQINRILGRAGPSSLHYEVGFIGGSPLGPFVTAWFDIQVALVLIGFLYLLFRVKKDEKIIAWMVAGLVMLVVMSIWFIPRFSAGILIDRVYIIGSIFFTSFSASVLLLLYKRKYAKTLLIIYLLLNLPMNMFLPAHSKYTYYHNEAAIPAEMNVIREAPKDAEFVLQVWVDQHTSENSFLVSFGIINGFLIHGQIIGDPSPFSNKTDYVILDHFGLIHGFWATGDWDYEVIDVTVLLNQSSVVYNNGRAVLISLKSGSVTAES